MTQILRFNQLRGLGLHRHYIFAALLASLLFFSYFSTPILSRSGVTIATSRQISPREAAANSTLGFERIITLSPKQSWRTRGLKAAADLTGLEFTIPIQPPNPDELVHAFEQIGSADGVKRPQHGTAKAWFAHLDLLKYVITSRLSTALIVEDDIDWDVNLKQQLQLVSDNIRIFTNTPKEDPNPYGKNWDVLWIGHCGSIVGEESPRKLVFDDNTRCPTELYSGWSKHFLRDHLPNGKRTIQTSQLTVCTFGYAVTAESAPKVLMVVARGGNEAFDVAMSAACQQGHLNCIVVNPQLMNHYEPGEGYVSLVHEDDGQGESAEDVKLERKMGTTGNIVKSARCKALFNDVCMRPPSEI